MKVKEEVLEKKKKGYKDLLNEKNFLFNSFANIISRFGDGIDSIAFSLLVYKITGSTLLVATLYAINGIPNLVFGMVSGVVCKYVTDKKIMAICDFGRGACVTLIAALFITNNLEVWHLYVISFLNSSFESFKGPAATSIIPKILPIEKMEHGTAFSSTGEKLAELMGLAIAPFIIGVFGLGVAVVIDAFTFILCGLLILAIKIKDNTITNEKLTIKGYFVDLLEGFKYVKSRGAIINVVAFAAVLNALFVPINALQAPYVEGILKAGSSAMSIIGIAILLGIAVATSLAPKIKEKFKGRKMFIIGGFLVGIMYFSLSIIGNLPKRGMYIALFIDCFITGIGVLMINFPLNITLLKSVPQEYLPRVSAIIGAGALCASPIAACITGVVSEFLRVDTIYFILGIVVVILFLIQILNKNIKEFDNY